MSSTTGQTPKWHTGPSRPLSAMVRLLGNRETSMLTITETIQRPLSPTETLSLDTQRVMEAYLKHMEAGEKPETLAYAKVLMLKAMAMNR